MAYIMEMTYGESKNYNGDELKELFSSVGWSSAEYPEELVRAMRGYDAVFYAREGEKLVGLACAMDDGAMTAYVHYLLVLPSYQGHGIGLRLTEMLKERYKNFLKIALIASAGKEGFYSKCGFAVAEGTPMYFTKMKD